VSARHTLTGANGDSITKAGTSTAIEDISRGATLVSPSH
jgi:hypothetical protein